MTLPLNGISKPSQVALSAASDIKVDTKQQYAGFISVAIDIDLDGKKYTVRRYFPENSLRGLSHDQIIQDRTVKAQMMEMVEKMVNIAIAYNLGREKKNKQSIEEISLLRDQHTISRKIGQAQQKKDLEVVVPQKLHKYTPIRSANEKKFEALTYLQGKFKSDPNTTSTNKIKFKTVGDLKDQSDSVDNIDIDDLDALLNDTKKGTSEAGEKKKADQSSDKATTTTNSPAPDTVNQSAQKKLPPHQEMLNQLNHEGFAMAELLAAAIKLPVISKEDSDLYRKEVERFQNILSARLKEYPEQTKDKNIIAIKDKINELRQVFKNPNLKEVVTQVKQQANLAQEKEQRKIQEKILALETEAVALRKLGKKRREEAFGPGKLIDVERKLQQAKSELLKYQSKQPTLTTKDVIERRQNKLSDVDKSQPEIPPSKNATPSTLIKEKQLTEDHSESKVKERLSPNTVSTKEVPLAKKDIESALFENELSRIATLESGISDLIESLIDKNSLSPEDEKKYLDQQNALREALDSALKKIPLDTQEPSATKLKEKASDIQNSLDQLGHLPLHEMIAISKILKEQINLEKDLEEIEHTSPQTYKIEKAFDERKKELFKQIAEKQSAMQDILESNPRPQDAFPPIGSISEHIEEKPTSELEKRYRELLKQMEKLAGMVKKAERTRIVTDNAEEDYKVEHEKFRNVLDDFENAIPKNHPNAQEIQDDVLKFRNGFKNPSLRDFINGASASQVLIETKQRVFKEKLTALTNVLQTALSKASITSDDETAYKIAQTELMDSLSDYERSIPDGLSDRQEKMEAIKEFRRRFESQSLHGFIGSEAATQQNQKDEDPDENTSLEVLLEPINPPPSIPESSADETKVKDDIKAFSGAFDNLRTFLDAAVTDATLLDDPDRFNELIDVFKKISVQKGILNSSYAEITRIKKNVEGEDLQRVIAFMEQCYSNLHTTMSTPFLDLVLNKKTLKNALVESHKEMLKLTELVKKLQE